jgi:hypothetical protein
MEDNINPIMRDLFKNTAIISKYFTIEMWMAEDSAKALNKLLNKVAYFDLDGYHLVCPECGEVLVE